MGRGTLALVTLLALLGAPALGKAQGFEYGPTGTRALGRGGAFAARADNPMALGYNPAALAFLPGTQIMLGSHLAFYDACVQPTGSYGGVGSFYQSRFSQPDGTFGFTGMNYPQVCRGGYPGPSPQLVFTHHIMPGLGIGVGILAPAGVGNGTWGNADGTITANGMTVPTPTRYALAKQDLLLFHPTIGVGYSPVDWISFGVSLQWGIALVDFVNYSSINDGTNSDPANDARTHLNVNDFFVPAIIGSVHVRPIDQLDIVATARFSDGINANGTLGVTTGAFGTSMPGSLTPYTTTLQGAKLHAGQPWTFTLAARYADRTHTHYRDPEEASRVTGRIEDSMQNETWDIEVDATYQLNTQVTDFVVTPPSGAAVTVCDGSSSQSACSPTAMGGMGTGLNVPLPGTLPIPHGWNDQLFIKVGGDWNVLPGLLALRAGANFMTSGLSGRYQIQDFIPLMSLGLNLGLTVRVDRFDISVAYSHIFQFSQTVSDGNYRMIAATGTSGQCGGPSGASYDASQPVSSRGCYPQGFGSVVNNGTYSGSMNVASLQVRYHFQ